MSSDSRHVDVPFDAAELQHRCLQNLALAQRVLRAFLTSGPQYVAEIEQFVLAERWSDTARAAHRLKGASQNAAAGKLAACAAEIQACAVSQSASLSGMMAALREDWNHFERQAEDFLRQTIPARIPLSNP